MPWRLLRLALFIWLASATVAHADPISGSIAAIAGIWAAIGPIGQLVVTVGLEYGASLLEKALSPAAPPPAPVGVSTTASFGDTTPVGFPVGQTATPGTFIYGGEWGSAGATPNAYSTDVYVLADLPIPGKPGIWWNGQKDVIDWDAAPTAQGYPVLGARVNGVDHMWVRYLDGTQTTADAFLTAKFGAHPDRPWKSTMIGRGCAVVIVTALFDRDLFQDFNKYLFEPGETVWYDISRDSTTGGSGTQRWGDRSTWATTSNPKVIAYNLTRGVYYDDEWLFGGQDLAATRVPASSWIAAINECAVQIDLAGGGTEDQYRCGYYITADMEPLAVLEELDRACAGYTAELGGVFKTLAGAPGASIYSFTDADVLVTRPQQLEPFPAFAQTHNSVEGTYPEPAELWQSKDAPAQENADLIAADGGFELPVSIAYAAVPFATQVQRLMKAALNDSRRFRTHVINLPPDAWALEPGVDVVDWTSAWNGYSAKKFLVVEREGNPGFQQKVTLKEVDPGADFAWSPTDEAPTTPGFLGIVRPAAQVIADFAVAAATFNDGTGTPRRPGIAATWGSEQADVRAVLVTARVKATASVEWSGEINYATFPGGGILPHAFLPNLEYEVQGVYVPFGARPMTPSAWLPVTTPNVSDVTIADETITAQMLVQEIQNLLGSVIPMHGTRILNVEDLLGEIAENVADLTATTQQIKQVLAVKSNAQGAQIVVTQQVSLDNQQSIAEIDTTLDAVNGSLAAEVTARQQAVAGVNRAVASLTSTVAAQYAQLSAGGVLSWKASTGTDGVSTSVTMVVTASDGTTQVTAGTYTKIASDGHGGFTSQTISIADRQYWASSDETSLSLPMIYNATTGRLTVNQLDVNKISSISGELIIDGTTDNALGTEYIQVGSP